jgi:hypothetical protein
MESGNADFALLKGESSTTGSAFQRRQSDDDGRIVVPIIAFPYVPAYSPNLAASLIFDLPAIADIYLGRIRVRTHNTGTYTCIESRSELTAQWGVLVM